tara:strand:+ start:315 stop:677 length:363 start_codon:yes stop_codon:yes gene_type:complete
MSAGNYDFEIEQGATLTLNLSYKDSNGSVINLSSGYTARMKIKDGPDGSVIASTESSDSPNNTISIVLGSSGNNIVVTINATTTAGFNFDKAMYDLELVSGSVVDRVLEGRVTLDKSVSS